ncbi:MAG: prepilin-type N-terminal cleavage/methylation domain-containing protein [Planctomycetaceae bacterium]|jgi:prepilin-type N-terminal cleavage/methylation domain-containing protein|nr:prepilin-type N-terminal cleavage/methylation domain-containing protein [Planctomycetaceae bacterium]
MSNLDKNYCNENCPTAQFLAEVKLAQVNLCNWRVRYRFGFTLVELLVVVAIIGILATLITAAAFRVINTARLTEIRTKISDIEMALEMYKNKFGEYPPDAADREAVIRHIKKRWPRCPVVSSETQITVAGTDIESRLDDRDSLMFWLGGYKNSDGKYCGFGVNKLNPFGVNDGGESKDYDNEVFIDIVDDNSMSFGTVRFITIRGAPVVYFRGKKGGGPNAYNALPVTVQGFGTIVPYKKDATKWHNPETYQLIHPGADDTFGSGNGARLTDGTEPLSEGDYDNITNLGTSTVEALLP